MTLLVAGLLQNVYASLDRYLQAQLFFPNGAPIQIRLHGVRRFVPPPDDPWVEAHYDMLTLTPTFWRIGGNQAVTSRRGYIQLHIFQRARVFTTRYTTAMARDLVVSAFPEGALIPIYDVTQVTDITDVAAPQVSVLVADQVQDHVLDDGEASGVIAHMVQVTTRYLEHATRA